MPKKESSITNRPSVIVAPQRVPTPNSNNTTSCDYSSDSCEPPPKRPCVRSYFDDNEKNKVKSELDNNNDQEGSLLRDILLNKSSESQFFKKDVPRQ